ncbi:SusC/RagA family TonB-linked outer membrane protein [Polaribacter aquimarinus]|uniref:SusC/RagA family TonB-linked outer membrane protein n=1 Tax=Polaribacter aquimarinus TaxID=2100726 RepID=A0A2U2J8A1_9FLAO|nr:TonB-dependent receptor [Polaribacter aquimarinus]PWG04566.1 SusC/RagA family TonB-linked outer membrane protein [Polaribacter aquimarinus]
MNLKFKSIFIVALLFCVATFAQEVTVKGTVTSQTDGEPILGANIIIVGTKKGTSTDFDGNYQIKVKRGEVIQVSYLGFKTRTIPYAGQKRINVQLTEDAAQLEEIVIVGYGTQKKSHLTGAISKVKTEKLDQIAVARVDDALVGQVSGVNIQATEGEAGSAPTIRIRGTGSISGSSDPAVVVDGVVVDADFLTNLDMNDIESFEILKDAASGSIYGSRGANGVVIITTKSGKEGKTKFSYNTFTGFKEARQSSKYYFTVAETARKEMAATGSISDQTRYKQLIGVDRDWQDVIFDGGMIESHSFAARGGNENTKFSISLGYQKDEGVLLTDEFKKYSMRIKVDTKLNKKLSFGANISPSYSDRRRFDGSTHDILRQTPWLPLYHDENTIKFVNTFKYPNVKIGDYATQRHFDDFDLTTMMPVPSGGTDISNTSNTNPAAKVLERDRNDYKFKLFGSFYGKYKIMKGLTFKTSLSGDFGNTRRDRWQGVMASRNGAAAAQLDLSSENRIHYVLDNLLTYSKEFGKHEINAVAGISREKWNWDFESSRGTGYESDLIKTISGATLIADAQSYKYERSLQSYLGRVNYAFDDKYLISLSFRRDGFSSFGPQQKYGNFPSASVGWTVSKENFFKELDFFNFLKLRFSYGTTGNPSLRTGDPVVDSYPYLSLIQGSTAVIDNNVVGGFNPINIENPNLQWERSVEMNPAIDFGFFNNRISGSIDYYQRTSDKLLLFNPVSATTGFTEAISNLGKVRNSGFEFELRTRNIAKQDFKWNSTFIASRNKNELLDFADSDGQIQNVDTKRAAEWINSVGNPISSFYGWVVDKDIPLEFLNNPYHPVGAEAQDVYVRDLNGDGLIDDDDKTILGNPYPDLVWSITNEFKLGNFDGSFMFQGSHGAEVRNMGDQYLFNHFNSRQDFNTSTTPNQQFIKQKIFTNDIIQDASYIALRTVNLGYTLDSDAAAKLNISKLRFFVSGQNLMYLTASDYTGFNPESINTTTATTYGYQRAGSPINRTITLGLNIEF